MLQELEVRKGVVHAVLNQALGKVMAVLSVLSEMALRLLSKACPTCRGKGCVFPPAFISTQEPSCKCHGCKFNSGCKFKFLRVKKVPNDGLLL